MNIREELEALRDHWKKIENAHRKMEESSTSNGIAMGVAECVRDIDALLQRIPEGCDLRPRKASVDQRRSGSMVLYYAGYNGDEYEAETAACECWRAMWDAASEEKGDE